MSEQTKLGKLLAEIKHVDRLIELTSDEFPETARTLRDWKQDIEAQMEYGRRYYARMLYECRERLPRAENAGVKDGLLRGIEEAERELAAVKQ